MTKVQSKMIHASALTVIAIAAFMLAEIFGSVLLTTVEVSNVVAVFTGWFAWGLAGCILTARLKDASNYGLMVMGIFTLLGFALTSFFYGIAVLGLIVLAVSMSGVFKK